MADEENADDHILTWSPSAKENIRSHSQSLGSGLQHHFGGTRLGTKKDTSNFHPTPSAKTGNLQGGWVIPEESPQHCAQANGCGETEAPKRDLSRLS